MADNFAHFKVHQKSGRNRGPRKAPKKDDLSKKERRSQRNKEKKDKKGQAEQSEVVVTE